MMLPVLLLITSTFTQIEGLKCFQCKYSPDIVGHHGGCKDEHSMQKYLTECKPPSNPANSRKTRSNTAINRHSSHRNPSSKIPATSIAPIKHASSINLTSHLLGHLYCFTQTSLLNGHWLIERGCGPAKVPLDLHDTCEKIGDKNSSSLNVTHAKICYCGEDGCNAKIPEELSNHLQNSNSSVLLTNNQNKTHEISGDNDSNKNNTSDMKITEGNASEIKQNMHMDSLSPSNGPARISLPENNLETTEKQNISGNNNQSNRTKNKNHVSSEENSENGKTASTELPNEISKAIEKSKTSISCTFIFTIISLSVYFYFYS